AEHNRDIDCAYWIVGADERWEGHEGATRFYTGLLAACPDIDTLGHRRRPAGVCEEAPVTATHVADRLGWRGTGERVEFDVVIFFPWDRQRRLFRGEKVYVHRDGVRG
ncbi:MAG TPA: hypothetical protein VGU26_03510, partial [Gaiellaceae bacterium]|nr:hypothetical protein [Gaiellaceae bacterium]